MGVSKRKLQRKIKMFNNFYQAIGDHGTPQKDWKVIGHIVGNQVSMNRTLKSTRREKK